jgi:hypothetical protein
MTLNKGKEKYNILMEIFLKEILIIILKKVKVK